MPAFDIRLFQTILILAGTPFFLFIDSPWFSPFCSFGQGITNSIMVIMYGWVLLYSKRRLYWLILLMTMVGLVAEIIGSQILTLYQYRLHNIPLYIPLGHAVIYATAYNIGNYPLVWNHHRIIENYLAKFAFIAVLMSLFLLKDVFGFLCYILFLSIIRTRTKPFFYLSIFAMVYYIELCGTVLSTWSYYGVVGNHPQLPSIGYTPSGIAGLYALIDLVSNSIYCHVKKTLRYIRQFISYQTWLPNKIFNLLKVFNN